MNNADNTKVNKILIFTGVILIFFIITAIWSIPRPSGDLYISLAAGRDVLSGELNTPDNWSFSTGGRVWINQNWGADVIIYLVEKFSGNTGVLVLKYVLLLLCALFIILALQKLKIPLPVSLCIAALVIASMNVYLILRPNLFTVTFVPLQLWLLYKTSDRPHLIWLVVLVTVLWANIHGGFILGLGMISLWAACHIFPGVIRLKWKIFRSKWQLAAAAGAAFLLCGLVNPFGFTNLVFPFMMANGGVWNRMWDWQPIWKTRLLPGFMSGINCFFIVIGITLLLLVVRSGYSVFRYFRLKREKTADKEELPVILFDAILAVVSVAMAFSSNRFLVIALILTAPILARQLRWIKGIIRWDWILPVVLNCALFIFGAIVIGDNIRNYDPDNPLKNTGPGKFFEKMHYVDMNYDTRLAGFINANRISGNVISPWQWEGFLRWNCPQLKIFTGGRAQQVYSEKTFNQYMYLFGSRANTLSGKTPEAVLKSIDAHLLITGNSEDFYDMILTALKSGNWVIVYADERGFLFADTSWPATAKIAEQLAADRLNFENPALAAMSKAAFIFSQPRLWKTQDVLKLFSGAYAYTPAWLWSYKMLFTNLQHDPDLFRQVTDLFDKQLSYLETLALDGSDAADILRCRISLSDMLYTLAKQRHQVEAAAQKLKSNEKAKALFSQLKKKWKQVLIN